MKTKEEIRVFAIKKYPYYNEYGVEQACGESLQQIAFINGYNQCQQDMADKLKFINETLVKIRDCNDYGNNSSTLARELIETLNSLKYNRNYHR